MSQTPPFRDVVTEQADLRLLYGEPSDIARRKDNRASVSYVPEPPHRERTAQRI
jgi:hypothetical protein